MQSAGRAWDATGRPDVGSSNATSLGAAGVGRCRCAPAVEVRGLPRGALDGELDDVEAEGARDVARRGRAVGADDHRAHREIRVERLELVGTQPRGSAVRRSRRPRWRASRSR